MMFEAIKPNSCRVHIIEKSTGELKAVFRIDHCQKETRFLIDVDNKPSLITSEDFRGEREERNARRFLKNMYEEDLANFLFKSIAHELHKD
jgi:hypothetical protein